MAVIEAFFDTHSHNNYSFGVNFQGGNKTHKKRVFLDFCNPFGRMSPTFYGCKLPTIERSVFEELEQTWAIGEPTLEVAVGETLTDHHESF